MGHLRHLVTVKEGGQGEEEGPGGGREGERVQIAAAQGSSGREGRTGSGGGKGRRVVMMEGWQQTPANSSNTFLRAQTSHQESFAPYSNKRYRREMKQHINKLHFDVSFSKKNP